ncbi:fused MFS/spermidine synthase [Falsarthrobacter nasiphocae]|uniref:Spermidine synthase n=1 Tax=Falsarthrobacter nasiphocae TaxID=189863 RepID=A0AAE3YGL8_9MICC|nr:fused MFS/spermidine synthase [Falsarthrobacter nasiphocae]MDR6892845.1 hypothetical protein [Falsarthrobacter nasiphocae]
MSRARSIRLSLTDAHAEIVEDTLVEGAEILVIGGREQSHVDVADPSHIFYAYLDRLRNGVEEFFPAAEPLRIAHVGAGALTLARALEATRPGSEHVAVDVEPRLVPFVLEHLPFAGRLSVIAEDGLAWAEAAASRGERADLVVVDIFTGQDSPAHLARAEYYSLLRRLLDDRHGGLVAVNLGDDPPLDFTRAQLGHLREAFGDESAVVLATETEMLSRRVPGNSIALASPAGFPPDFEARWAARGPHPGIAARGLALDEAFGF